MKEFLQATAVVIVILVAILGFFGFIAHLTSLLELSDQNKSARDGLVELAKREHAVLMPAGSYKAKLIYPEGHLQYVE